MRRPKFRGIWQTNKAEGLPFDYIGNVVHVPTGGNTVHVRLSNIAGQTIRNVVIAEGLKLQTGDRVLLAHTRDDPHWIAITRVLDTEEHGLYTAEMLGENELHPPHNFVVTGGVGMVIAEWDAYTGNTVCWEVFHNSSASSTGQENLYTRGSYFIYPVTGAAETRFVRIRALRYDVETNVAYYSRTTAWSSATSIVATGSSGELPVVGSGGQPTFHIDGPLAVGTNVAEQLLFNQSGEIDSVSLTLKNKGSVGSTKVDVNNSRLGASLWVVAASQPEMFASNPSDYVLVSNPDNYQIQTGDILTLDIDSVATGAVDATVTIFMRGSSEEMASHAHSGGPHTGTLDFDELQYNTSIQRLIARQGGDGTNWGTGGTTDYTPTSFRTQAGAKNVYVDLSHYAAFSVTFPTAFVGTPVLTIGLHSTNIDATSGYKIDTLSSTGFSGRATITNDETATITIMWMAVGAV
jgi:hypothetical protein